MKLDKHTTGRSFSIGSILVLCTQSLVCMLVTLESWTIVDVARVHLSW
jgi:hypothetical protein